MYSTYRNNTSLILEDTTYLLTNSTPTIARTRGLLLPAQNIHLFERFYIKIVWCIILTLYTILFAKAFFLPVANIYNSTCNNLCKVEIWSTNYMSNNFLFYTSGKRPNTCYFTAAETCSFNLQFLHRSCAVTNYILLLLISATKRGFHTLKLSRFVAQVFSDWFCYSSSCPCYYWYHLYFSTPHALYFCSKILVTLESSRFLSRSHFCFLKLQHVSTYTVPPSLSQNMMPYLLSEMDLSVCVCFFYNII